MKLLAFYPMDTIWEKAMPIVFSATSPLEGLEERLSQLTYEKNKYLVELPERIRECDADKRPFYIRQQLSYYGDQVAQLMAYRESLPPDEVYKKIVQFCEAQITLFESILLHIQKEYTRFIDKDQHMPKGQMLKAKTRISARVAQLRSRLTSPDGDSKLLAIALDPYERILEEPERLLTYQQYEYCQQYLDELETINPDDDIDCKLRTALVYMNLNTRAFLHYCYKTVNQEVQALSSTAEKLDKLEELNKIFSQLRTKPGCYFTDTEPNTVDLLLRIVKGEKKHIRKQKKIYRDSPLTAGELPAGGLKLKSKFTIEQWGALLKFLYKDQHITNRVIMDFLRAFASIVETEKKDVISVDSLKGKFYTVSPEMKIWLQESFRSWYKKLSSGEVNI